jgi:lipoate-protein ligase A
VLVNCAGSQLETERAKALSHEATAEELKQRIATLQELKLKEQLEHSEAIDKMIAQLKDAQAKVAEASEVRKKAEVKCITAREWVC